MSSLSESWGRDWDSEIVVCAEVSFSMRVWRAAGLGLRGEGVVGRWWVSVLSAPSGLEGWLEGWWGNLVIDILCSGGSMAGCIYMVFCSSSDFGCRGAWKVENA